MILFENNIIPPLITDPGTVFTDNTGWTNVDGTINFYPIRTLKDAFETCPYAVSASGVRVRFRKDVADFTLAATDRIAFEIRVDITTNDVENKTLIGAFLLLDQALVKSRQATFEITPNTWTQVALAKDDFTSGTDPFDGTTWSQLQITVDAITSPASQIFYATINNFRKNYVADQCCVLCFDDGYDDVRTNGLPILDAAYSDRGVPISWGLIGGSRNGDFLSDANIASLANRTSRPRVEFTNHSQLHANNLYLTTPLNIEVEYQRARVANTTSGGNVGNSQDHVWYPFSGQSNNVFSAMQRLFRTGRTTLNNSTVMCVPGPKFGGRYGRGVFTVNNNTLTATISTIVNRNIAAHRPTCLLYHRIVTGAADTAIKRTTTDFDADVDVLLAAYAEDEWHHWSTFAERALASNSL